MTASMTIEVGIETPVRITSASELRDLAPSNLRWVSIKLLAEGAPAVTFTARSEEAPFLIHDLVDFAQIAQPAGTEVHVWFQGRSERIEI